MGIARGPLASGEKEVHIKRCVRSSRWTQSCPRTGGVLAALPENILLRASRQQDWWPPLKAFLRCSLRMRPQSIASIVGRERLAPRAPAGHTPRLKSRFRPRRHAPSQSSAIDESERNRTWMSREECCSGAGLPQSDDLAIDRQFATSRLIRVLAFLEVVGVAGESEAVENEGNAL